MTAAAGLISSFVENRNDQFLVQPVWEYVSTFSVVSGDTTGAITIPMNGIARHFTYKTPNTTNNDLTSTLTVSDNDGNIIFTTGAGIAENTTNNYSVDLPLSGDVVVDITFNEDVGVSADFVFIMRGV